MAFLIVDILSGFSFCITNIKIKKSKDKWINSWIEDI